MSFGSSSNSPTSVASTSCLASQVDHHNRIEDLSVFDMLSVLRRRMFVGLEELKHNVTLATKDESGNIDWVILTPAYHGTLVKTAIRLVLDGTMAPDMVPLIKRVLFVFLLELLQVGEDSSFLTLQKGAMAYNHSQHEKKRLARKRSRAAKRERERIEKKGGHVVVALKSGNEQPLTCPDCTVPFRSRKQLKKHTCAKKSASKQDVATTHSTVTPAVTVPSPVILSSALASSAPLLFSTAPLSTCDLPQEEDSSTLAPVVEYSRWAKSKGVARVCENCPTIVASFVVMHGDFETCCYLKCVDCNRGRGVYLPDCERW
ncbi:hypothetical protein BDR07DRAFT_899496 [Suillus spraguei]|nr:hypothetical protein BDR07DRAFT_899496 [Suillus spraguei]